MAPDAMAILQTQTEYEAYENGYLIYEKRTGDARTPPAVKCHPKHPGRDAGAFVSRFKF